MMEILGKFHPLLVHLPIGFFTLGLLLHVLKSRKLLEVNDPLIRWVTGTNALVAALSALTGYLLSQDGDYAGDLVLYHRNAAIVFTVMSVALFLSYIRKRNWLVQNIFWALGLVAMIFAGHLGGSLTHGEDFLSFGAEEYVRPLIVDPQQALVYDEVILPVFAEKCWKCHSPSAKKGGLRLDSPENIMKGGKNGKILTAHDPGNSELMRRLLLEKSHEEHMPPSGKTQLTAEEITLIKWWIDQGVPTKGKVIDIAQSEEVKLALATLVNRPISKVDLPDIKIQAVDDQTLKQLTKMGFVGSPVEMGSTFLSVSLYKSLGESFDQAVWNKAAPNVVWFRAVGIDIDEKLVSSLKSCKNLYQLEVRNCNILSSLAPLENLKSLKQLNLQGTKISKEDLKVFISIPALKQVYLFESGIQMADIPQRSDLLINTGAYQIPTYPSDTILLTREDLVKSLESLQ